MSTKMMKCIVDGVEEMRPVHYIKQIDVSTHNNVEFVDGLHYPVLMPYEEVVNHWCDGTAIVSSGDKYLVDDNFINNWRKEREKGG